MATEAVSFSPFRLISHTVESFKISIHSNMQLKILTHLNQVVLTTFIHECTSKYKECMENNLEQASLFLRGSMHQISGTLKHARCCGYPPYLSSSTISWKA